MLDENRAKRIVLGTLNAQLERLSGRCAGFVVMPDHVHAILWFPESGCLSECMKQWKRTSSYLIHKLFEDVLPRYRQESTSTPVWQRKYYDFNLYSEGKLQEKLAYMHLNPVRAGLVSRAIDWPWSSARYYVLGKSVGVAVGWLE